MIQKILVEYMNIDKWQSLSACFMILFAILDPIGSLAVIIGLKKKVGGDIDSLKASMACFALMVAFLIFGDTILALFSIDTTSFALAGGIVIFILGLELLLGVSFFKIDISTYKIMPIIPIAFPLFVGAGTFTTLITLKAEYGILNCFISIIINCIIIYFAIKYSSWIEKKIGNTGVSFTKKIMGVILIAIAIKIFRSNL